jgi:hypothetical protein
MLIVGDSCGLVLEHGAMPGDAGWRDELDVIGICLDAAMALKSSEAWNG